MTVLRSLLFDRLLNIAWITGAVAIVLVALYVLLASQLLALLPERRSEVAAWISERLGMRVVIDRMDADMRLLTPVVRLRGVRLYVQGHADERDQVAVAAEAAAMAALSVPVIDMELDTLATLLTLRPVFGLLRIEGLDLTVAEDEDGRFRIKGLPFNVNDPLAAERFRRALTVLYRQSNILVERSHLFIESDQLPVTALDSLRLRMRNDGHDHVVAGSALLRGPGALPVSFVLRFAGEPLLPADLVADVYVRTQPASLEGWLPRRDPGNVWIDSFSGGGEVWLHLERARVTAVTGRLQIDSLAVSLADGRKLEGLLDLNTRFHWQPNGKTGGRGGTLALSGLSFRRAGLRWPETDAALAFARDADDRLTVRAMVSRGNVQMLAGLADVLPPEQLSLRAALTRMAPVGQLTDVRLHWDDTATPSARWRLAADFSQVALRADGPVPGINDLSGHLEWLPKSGMAALALHKTELALPTLFAAPLALDEAALQVAWQRVGDGWQLRSNRFVMRNADARASGLLTLTLPGSGASPHLSLLGLIEDGNVGAAPRYLPLTLGTGLRDWLLQSGMDGRLRRGSFVFEGPLRREDALPAQRIFQMRYEGAEMSLAFLSGWPRIRDLDADVLLANGQARAHGRAGRLLDSVLGDFRVDVTPQSSGQSSGTSHLRVQTHLAGGLGDAFTIFRDTPLRSVVPGELLRWDGSGRLDADVDLKMLLGQAQAPRVTIAGRIDGATLAARVHALEVNDVSGDFRFDTVEGFSAKNLRGLTLGNVFSGSARTLPVAGRQQTRVDLRGRFSMQPVSSWLKIPAFDVLRGESDATVALRFDTAPGGSAWLDVHSNLRGIAVAAPAPLGKSASVPMDTRLSYQLGTETPRLTLTFGRVLAADLNFRGGSLVGGRVALGPVRLPPEEPAGAAQQKENGGLIVEGQLATLSVADWATFMGRLTGAVSAAATAPTPTAAVSVSDIVGGITELGNRLRRLHVSTGRLDAGGIKIDAATLRMNHEESGWTVGVDSKTVRGQVILPDGYRERGETPMVIQLETLVLPAAAATQLGSSQLLPADIPHLTLVLNSIRIGNDDYGSWFLEAIPEADGSAVRLRDVRGLWRSLDIRGDGVWRVQPAGTTQTQFTGVAQADDLAQVSTAFGFAPNLGSSKATTQFDLVWPGRPIDIDPLKVKGTLALDFRDGRFVTADARTEALRAFGIFNINTWQRRMKFNFSDLYKKGVAFDTLTGNIVLDAGRISTDNLVVKGPSAMFELAGSTDLSTQVLDSQLRVTLPVGSNLYVGCLAGLAACAGIVAFEKLWGDRLEKMATLSYDVDGTWTDPQVKQIDATDIAPTSSAKK